MSRAPTSRRTCSAAPSPLADHNKVGRADLSVGAGGENSDDGAVWVLHCSTGGITATDAVSFGASSVGIGNSGDDPVFEDALPGS
ncbi:hypothetical protein [Streptomyces sp. NPDC056661]|uniref:hypothetical protein n=1 Tax=Streptomyces sp. NPDC056661 TaxID=3345898 RepID=UPI0036C8B945